MKLRKGDWVRTEKGEVGKVVLISRLTAFVEVKSADNQSRIISCLASQLTRIDPAQDNHGQPKALQ